MQIVHGALGILAAHKVLRQFGSDLARLRAIGGLQTRPQALVQSHAPSRSQPLVHHLLIQGMHKGIAGRHRPVGPGRHPQGVQELLLHQRLAVLLHRVGVDLEARRHRRGHKLHPRYTRHLQHPLGLRRQARDLLLEQLPQALGHLQGQGLDVPLHGPAPVLCRAARPAPRTPAPE